MTHIDTYTNLVILQCWAKEGCGVSFGLPRELYEAERIHKKTGFYCPRGHHLGLGEGAVEKLERKLKQQRMRSQAEEDQLRADRDYHKRSAAAAKGQVTKIKKRVGNGVCPCCKRTFKDLAQHMANKHPEFVEER